MRRGVSFKIFNSLDRIGPDVRQNLYQKMDQVFKSCYDNKCMFYAIKTS